MTQTPSTSTPDAGSVWNRIPLVYCINLRERPERLAEAQAEFARVGLRRVQVYRTERQKDRDKAIIDSHMAVLRHAIEAAAPYFLVLEDDVAFLPGAVGNLGRSLDFLKERPDWRLFHLGGFVFRKAERCTREVIRGGVLTTHAYLMQAEFARLLLAKRPWVTGMSVDLFYSAMAGDEALVHTHPMIATQRASASDGTWDTAGRNSAGWLGKAMEYTTLDWGERWRYSALPWVERLKIQNGISFFKIYRGVMRRRLASMERRCAAGRAEPVTDPGPPGEFVEWAGPGAGG